MGLSFEVKESDLLGRIGVLTVGGKQVETPCLFPVIHPVRQSVSTRELSEMGYRGLMTNSLILYGRRRDEAVAKGLHKLLDFDGMFMTDSGGYQVLEYGQVDVDHRRIAQFQSSIGSDLAVTLDRPTGYSLSRKYASETMKYSLENALATIREFRSSDTSWIGPVQGGLFESLLRESTRKLVAGGFDMLALGSPTQVMENYRFAELTSMIVATRAAMPYSMPLHLFGAGHPLTMAMSVALGCDTFDSASYVLFARKGRYMTGRGVLRLEQMRYLPCSCPACVKTTLQELGEMEHAERTKAVALHNLYVLREEMLSCKEAIAEGRLWDLVEEKASSHPRLSEAFLSLVRKSAQLRDGTAAIKGRGLFVRGPQDRERPELLTAAAMLERAFTKRCSTALLVLGGEGVPFGRLRFSRRAFRMGSFDAYRLHPVLGAFPAELEFVYPFTQTVGPYDGGLDERGLLREARSRLKREGYRRVAIARADEGGEVVPLMVRSRRTPRVASPYPPST
ncbi:MAG TPA: tRNA guanosine(15) transglycosylase TgtA [Nitrososphaerales archaeon]|nr:tRNA guanosine(15) transglycosylase TgtA [Nitrososphaerales archaeon]